MITVDIPDEERRQRYIIANGNNPMARINLIIHDHLMHQKLLKEKIKQRKQQANEDLWWLAH
jgi:hypothetical protein